MKSQRPRKKNARKPRTKRIQNPQSPEGVMPMGRGMPAKPRYQFEDQELPPAGFAQAVSNLAPIDQAPEKFESFGETIKKYFASPRPVAPPPPPPPAPTRSRKKKFAAVPYHIFLKLAEVDDKLKVTDKIKTKARAWSESKNPDGTHDIDRLQKYKPRDKNKQVQWNRLMKLIADGSGRDWFLQQYDDFAERTDTDTDTDTDTEPLKKKQKKKRRLPPPEKKQKKKRQKSPYNIFINLVEVDAKYKGPQKLSAKARVWSESKNPDGTHDIDRLQKYKPRDKNKLVEWNRLMKLIADGKKRKRKRKTTLSSAQFSSDSEDETPKKRKRKRKRKRNRIPAKRQKSPYHTFIKLAEVDAKYKGVTQKLSAKARGWSDSKNSDGTHDIDRLQKYKPRDKNKQIQWNEFIKHLKSRQN